MLQADVEIDPAAALIPGIWWSFTTMPGVPISFQAVSIAPQDGWIRARNVWAQLGGKVNRNGQVLRVGDDAKNRQFRSILSFDTSDIPEGAVITSVTLRFKYAGKKGSLPFGSHGNMLVIFAREPLATTKSYKKLISRRRPA